VDGLLGLEPFREWAVGNPGAGDDESAEMESPYVVDGIAYATEEGGDGRIRFSGNAAAMALARMERPRAFDHRDLDRAFGDGAFTKADYVAFHAMIGTALADFLVLPPFRDCVVEDCEGNPVVLPDREFRCAHASPGVDLVPARKATGIRSLGDEVLYGTPLGEAGHGALLAYLNRRFGPASMGGDPHKDLAGTWCLTTPDPDLFLLVTPGPGPAFSAFSPYMAGSGNEDEDLRQAPVDEARSAALRSAYRTALVDLLRPVSVDGEYLNALGEVDRGTLLMDFVPGPQGDTFVVPYSHASTVGIPVAIAGTRQWDELMSLVDHLGAGDPLQGIERLVSEGRETLFSEIRQRSRNVRVLVAAGSVGPWFDRVHAGLRTDPGEVVDAAVAARCLLGQGIGPVLKEELTEYTEAEAGEATRLLAALAIDAPMAKVLREYRHRCRLGRELETLRALAPAGFPETGDVRPHVLVRTLVPSLRELGNAGLADHVERLLGEKDGEHVLDAVLWSYLGQIARDKAKAGSVG
jgi:hypothetical protein